MGSLRRLPTQHHLLATQSSIPSILARLTNVMVVRLSSRDQVLLLTCSTVVVLRRDVNVWNAQHVQYVVEMRRK